MNDLEYELLDELYFVISFQDLQETLGWTESTLLAQLVPLLQKNWIKCLDFQDNILPASPENLPDYYEKCLFLATKEGLKAHNSL